MGPNMVHGLYRYGFEARQKQSTVVGWHGKRGDCVCFGVFWRAVIAGHGLESVTNMFASDCGGNREPRGPGCDAV